MASSGFPCRTAVGCARADLHGPSMDQQSGLEAAYSFVCIKYTPQIVGWTATVSEVPYKFFEIYKNILELF
jgi:hypothetical protein